MSLSNTQKKEGETVLGKITSVYGVKGWVKIYSYTDPLDNILEFRRWTLVKDGVRQVVDLKAGRKHGKGLVASIEGCSDRDKAQDYCGSLITVDTEQLPDLESGEYYWHQLEGLIVETTEEVVLGKVSHLIETGSNDVLVVKGDIDSKDRKERLIPYLPEQVVMRVDLEAGKIIVDWDPEF